MSAKKATKNTQNNAAHGGCSGVTCSPSSETPETDAESYDDPTPGYEVVLAEFARKLERQRNAALCREERLIDAVKHARQTLILNTLIDKSSLSQDTLNSLEWTLDAVCKFHRENSQADQL